MVDINQVSNSVPDIKQREISRNAGAKEEIIRHIIEKEKQTEEKKSSEAIKERVIIEREKGRRVNVSG